MQTLPTLDAARLQSDPVCPSTPFFSGRRISKRIYVARWAHGRDPNSTGAMLWLQPSLEYAPESLSCQSTPTPKRESNSCFVRRHTIAGPGAKPKPGGSC